MMRLLMPVVMCLAVAGCFEGPTGPQGEQGEQGIQGEPGPQGEKGDPGEPGGQVIAWDHVVKSAEVDLGDGFAVVTIEDDRFEESCGYEFWMLSSDGASMTSLMSISDGAMIYYLFHVGDGECQFTAFTSISGKTLRIFKHTPAASS